MSESYTIVYIPPKTPELPPIDNYRVGTILRDEYGDYWELIGRYNGSNPPVKPALWIKITKSRLRYLKRKGKIPK